MTGRAELVDALEADGYTVTEWADDADKHYPDHAHIRDEVLVVLEGAMTMIVGEMQRTLRPGDRIRLDAGEHHTVTIGRHGARYLVGKK